LAERVVLVQRDDLVIAVTSMIAFPTGVRFGCSPALRATSSVI
jgi:hypothetical protein